MAEREWFDKDYYKVLGLTPSATDKEITRAYRKLAKEHHPDTNKGSEDKFKEISVAYDVLGDAPKRKEYDSVRKMGPSAAGFGGQQRGGPQNFNFGQGDVGDLGDIFGGLFGNQGRRSRAQRGADIETALHISFRDAVFGEGKRRVFIDADLFILPTYSENFGIAVAEALAYGMPVITTTQAPWEGLLEHRCGWWVPVNVEGIGKALLEATRATSTELQEMGSRGQRWVRDEFAWPSIARRLIEAYEKYIP